MTKQEALKKIRFVLNDMINEGYFNIVRCEGEELVVLERGSEIKLLTFLENELEMKPPCVDGDKCQKLMCKFIDPNFNIWDEEYDKLIDEKV